MLAVKQAVPAVAGPAQRAATHRALDTSLVPGQFVDAQEEAVRDGRLAPCTHLTSSHMLWWRRTEQVSADRTQTNVPRRTRYTHITASLLIDKDYDTWIIQALCFVGLIGRIFTVRSGRGGLLKTWLVFFCFHSVPSFFGVLTEDQQCNKENSHIETQSDTVTLLWDAYNCLLVLSCFINHIYM